MVEEFGQLDDTSPFVYAEVKPFVTCRVDLERSGTLIPERGEVPIVISPLADIIEAEFAEKVFKVDFFFACSIFMLKLVYLFILYIDWTKLNRFLN